MPEEERYSQKNTLMTDKPPLNEEDRRIWFAYVQQEQIETSHVVDETSFEDLLEAESDTKTAPIADKNDVISAPASKRKVESQERSKQLDRRTDEKLRKGKMPIDARCDLHGLNQVDAHAMLRQFIGQAVLRGCRCVLVITGKGKSRVSTNAIIEPEAGILKQRLPQWLSEASISPYVLKHYPAQPKDGGSGALYVYLRRSR